MDATAPKTRSSSEDRAGRGAGGPRAERVCDVGRARADQRGKHRPRGEHWAADKCVGSGGRGWPGTRTAVSRLPRHRGDGRKRGERTAVGVSGRLPAGSRTDETESQPGEGLRVTGSLPVTFPGSPVQ